MTQPNAIEAAQAKELAALREQVTEFKKVNDELKITLQKQIEINAEQQVIIKTQRDQIDLLLRQKFGKSSEAMDAEQLMLLLQGDEAKKPDASEADVSALEAEIKRGEAEIAAARREERKRKTVRIPEHLPVIERIEIDPEEVKADPEAWRCIGEEVTEQIAMKRDGMGRRQIVRRKWVKKDEPHKAPIIGPLDTLQERSIAAPSLLAYLVNAKYCEHMPLYRLEKMFQRGYDVRIPRQTMCDWMGLTADWFEPIYGLIKQSVVTDGYIQTDETVIKYLVPGNGETKQGYLWTLRRPGQSVVYVWGPSRAASVLAGILPEDFSGIIGADGYSGNRSYVSSRDGQVKLAACWAHVRRKFLDAMKSKPVPSAAVVKLIQNLYAVEADLRQRELCPKLRAVERQARSAMIIERIGKLLRQWAEKEKFLPKSLMGKAIAYTLKLWPMLQVYLQHGEVEIDNNLVENSIRPTAVGKKNWLFIGAEGAGKRSAILYTIVEECRRLGIDPYRYITDVLTRLPTMTNQQYAEVTPEAWAKAQTKPNVPAPASAAQHPTNQSQAA